MAHTNRQIAESFAAMINGTQENSVSTYRGNFRARKDNSGNAYLYSYSTLIAYYEKGSQTLIFNVTRYSTTTSTKHQTHFYIICRNAYRVKHTVIVTGCKYCENDLKRYLVYNRYIAQDGRSWDGKPLYRVFDTVSKSTVCTYKKRSFAERKAKELNEAQAPSSRCSGSK